MEKMEKIAGMVLLTLERLSILKEYELEFITKDEALENLNELSRAIKQLGDLK